MIFNPSKEEVFPNPFHGSVPLRKGLGCSGWEAPHQNGARMIQTLRSAQESLCRNGCATSWSGWNANNYEKISTL